MPTPRIEKKKKLAIFDVDGTIFRSSLLIELVNGLVKEGVFPREVPALYQKAYRSWLDRESGYEEYITEVIAAFRKHIKGVKYGDLRRVAYKVVAEEKNRTYRYTRDLVKKLKARGYYVLAVSHSPKIAVEGFCKTLGFSKVYGIMYETADGGKHGGRRAGTYGLAESSFTGKVLFPEIVLEKSKLVEHALEGGGLTLKGSIGVGDTESDAAFLRMVSHPICFNPNAGLYAEAKRNGWEVVVERKDVIYKLN